MVRQSEALAAGLSKAGSAMIPVTVAVGALAVGVFQATAKMDSLVKGLESVAGGSAGAQIQLARLTEIAKRPGIGFAEAIQGSVRLQAIGFSAALAERSLKGFSNAIALTGGGRDELQRVTVQLGQLAAKGKVLTQDLRPIIEAAPAVGKALRDAFGTVNAEDIEKLGLSSQQFLDKLLTQLEQLPQVNGGLANSFENLKDAIFRTFAALGEDQAGGMAKSLNSLAKTVEGLGNAFRSLSPTTQRIIIGFIGAAAAIGPLLIVVSALIRAYQTLIALSLVSSTVAATRAFFAQAAAVTSLSQGLGLFATGIRGVAAAMMGPAGIALALTAVIGLFIKAKIEAAEALQKIKESIAGMSKASAQAALDTSVSSIQGLSAELTTLRTLVQRSGAGQGTRMGAMVRERARIRELEGQISVELEKQRAAAERLNAIQELSAPPSTGTTGTPEVPGGDKDKFKALKEYVGNLAEAVRLRLDDNKHIAEAQALENTLTERARARNLSLADAVTLLGLANSLADSLAGRLDSRIPKIDLSLPGGRTAEQDAVQNARVMAAETDLIGRAARAAGTPWNAIAKAAERARKAAEGLGRASSLTRGLAGLAAQFGRVGEELADILSRAGDVMDAMKEFRSSQAETGQNSPFANIGNMTSALGMATTAISLLATVFGQTETAADRRHKENVGALNDLRDQLATVHGANLASASQVGISRLLENLPKIAALGLTGSASEQRDFVNQLLADLGVSFADLNRLAKELGINLLTEGGKVAADALDEFAEALGYNVKIITQLNDTLETFRSTQDAYNRIFNIEDTPLSALQDALAELEQFAPAIYAQLTQGIDASTASGQAALREALKTLFTRLRGEGTSLAELGGFADINALIESLLKTDGALDRFRETTEAATASMLNVPQGFKVALRTFQATVAMPRPPTAPPTAPPPAPPVYMPPTGPAVTHPGTQPSMTVGSLTIPVSIQGGGDGKETYANLYDEMTRLSTANPQFRAILAAFPAPARN